MSGGDWDLERNAPAVDGPGYRYAREAGNGAIRENERKQRELDERLFDAPGLNKPRATINPPLFESANTLESALEIIEGISAQLFGNDVREDRPKPPGGDGSKVPVAQGAEYVMRLAQDLHGRLVKLQERI